MPEVHLVPDSSHMHSYSYHEESRVLTIWFQSNPSKPYRYSAVEPDIFHQLHEAPSKGKFFHGYIKGFYDYTPSPESTEEKN